VRIGTSATVLMYVLPPILRRLKTEYPQLEITLKAGLTQETLRMLKANALDLGLCALPVHDPAFDTTPLFQDELVDGQSQGRSEKGYASISCPLSDHSRA
jgi:DNA-binding transcriptional LysR family regulator